MQRRCIGRKTKWGKKKALTTRSCCNLSKQGSSCGTELLLWIVVITSGSEAPDDIRFESLAPILLLLLRRRQAPFFFFFLPSDSYEKLGNLTKSFNRIHHWNIIFKQWGYPSSIDKFFAVFFRGLNEERGNLSSRDTSQEQTNKHKTLIPGYWL